MQKVRLGIPLWAISVVLIITLAGRTHAALAETKVNCALELDHSAPGDLGFRRFLLQTSIEDSEKRFSSEISSLAEDSLEVQADLPVTGESNEHVISLGSGPDIFSPLYAFPRAKHFHLVDLSAGWSSGPAALFIEIEARLQSLAGGGTVERIQDGFLRWRPAPNLAGSYHIQGETAHVRGPWRLNLIGGNWIYHYYKQPCIWRVRGKDGTGQSFERYVYFHPGDFSDVEFIRSVLNTTRGQLGGLFISGVGLPKREPLQILLDTLKPEGIFIGQFEYRNSKGETSTDSEDQINERWLIEGMTVLAKRESTEAERQAKPRLYHPTLYVLQKAREPAN